MKLMQLLFWWKYAEYNGPMDIENFATTEVV